MDWFERLTGFAEGPPTEAGYRDTQRRLAIVDGRLHAQGHDQTHGVGTLELPSLQSLRQRVQSGPELPGRLRVQIVQGDVRRLHREPAFAGALFQVASQFNLLEMMSPSYTPEHGVGIYARDGTQGPACAMAAGAATIYRNYLVPVGEGLGQTRMRQLDGLADLGAALSRELGRPLESLWTMRNGYALCTADGLDAITAYLDRCGADAADALRGLLRIGLHRDVEVTDAEGPVRPSVSQAFCSALPVAYSHVPSHQWRAFATLVLESAYETTLLAAVETAQCGGSNIVLLTRLGGGAFGNRREWIDAAMRRAFDRLRRFDLDVRLVSYGEPGPDLKQMERDFG